MAVGWDSYWLNIHLLQDFLQLQFIYVNAERKQEGQQAACLIKNQLFLSFFCLEADGAADWTCTKLHLSIYYEQVVPAISQ